MIPPIFNEANIIIIRIQYTIPYLKLKRNNMTMSLFVDERYEIMVFLHELTSKMLYNDLTSKMLYNDLTSKMLYNDLIYKSKMLYNDLHMVRQMGLIVCSL